LKGPLEIYFMCVCIYIYIYMCVCVCVCMRVCACNKEINCICKKCCIISVIYYTNCSLFHNFSCYKFYTKIL